jgi:predicted transcriptional regulator
MEAVYEIGGGSVSDVRERLPDPPGYSAVRATMSILERKGYLKHEKRGHRFIFLPSVPKEKEARRALKRLVSGYFDGSVEHAVSALLSIEKARLGAADYERLSRLINEARKVGK